MSKSEIQIEFKVINTEFQKAMKEMGSDVARLNREFKLEQEQLRLNGTEKEKLESRVKYLNERYNMQQKEVQATTLHLEKAKEVYGENSKEVQQLENRLLEAQRKEAYFANEVQAATKELAEQNDKLLQLGKSMQETGKKMQDIGKSMTDTGKNLTTRVTLPIVGIAGAAVKLGVDFEKSMSEVQAVTGATGDELEILEKAARDAGATTDKSARDAADGLKYLGLAGWSVADSQAGLMPLLKLSSAGNMELGRTADLVTDGMSALKLEIDDLDSYLDILAETSRNSNTSVEELGEAFVVVGGRLSLLEVETSEAATALGLLGDNGIKGSEAGRGLNAILTNLTAPTGRAKTALEELGVSAFDTAGEFIGIEETLKLVEDATEGMTMEQQNMYFSMIAGKEHSKTFNALMSGLGDGFDTLGGKVAGADGALEEMYTTMTDNTMGSIDELMSAIEELGLKLWDNLQPAIEDIIAVVQGLTDKFNELTPEQQENIVRIWLMVAAIGPALLIIGKLIGIVGTVIGVLGKLAVIVKGAGLAVGAISLPIAIAIGAIAAIIAVGVALYKNWDTIKEKAVNFGNSVKNTFNNIKESISNAINKARDAVRNAIEKIKSFFKFEWSLPKLKMPKISMEGKFSLVPPSVPKFSIKWNKEGAIFTKPTIFNTRQGLQGVGEAGPEAILPISKLADMIRNIIIPENYLQVPGEDLVLILEIPLDGRVIAKQTVRFTAEELENLRFRKGR